MTKREIIKLALNHKPVDYVPWSCNFTSEAAEKLIKHYGTEDIDSALGNHLVSFGNGNGICQDIGSCKVKDQFGVVWDRSKDKDIGIVEGAVLPEPTLQGYDFPDPCDETFYKDIESIIEKRSDCFRVFDIGFSLLA